MTLRASKRQRANDITVRTHRKRLFLLGKFVPIRSYIQRERGEKIEAGTGFEDAGRGGRRPPELEKHRAKRGCLFKHKQNMICDSFYRPYSSVPSLFVLRLFFDLSFFPCFCSCLLFFSLRFAADSL